jgi:hypothetical protein
MSLVEQTYRERIDAMKPAERIAYAAAMLKWVREAIARHIIEEQGPMSDERVKWLVALRQYQAEPAVCAMIERMLDRVPD